MSSLGSRARIFEEMGIGPEWVLRTSQEAIIEEDLNVENEVAYEVAPQETSKERMRPIAEITSEIKPVLKAGETSTFVASQTFESWESLNECVQQCNLCPLGRTRTQTVLGIGDVKAKWLFIGEGPGFYEDQQGEPFVGKSGELLDNMLKALDLERGDNVYIANIVKCRAMDTSKKDRPPTEEEASQCLPYLMWQIQTISPKVIVALGKTAATSLLKVDRSVTMNALRGKTHLLEIEGKKIPLIVTYHPSYLLRTSIAKRQAWEDLRLAYLSKI